jgi:hypothetical protein
MSVERLTEVRNGEAVIPLRNAVCGVNMPRWCINNESDIQSFLSGDAADRLAAYEDTGLTPEEINHYRWTPVTERLPVDGRYLARVDGVYGDYIAILGFCEKGEDVDYFGLRGQENIFYDCDSEYGCYAVSGVTHWMPLPKPPKGE